jgi:hypothetical protein
METLDYPSWRWGLSLIALTMAIHAAAVVTMGIAAVKIRPRPAGPDQSIVRMLSTCSRACRISPSAVLR